MSEQFDSNHYIALITLCVLIINIVQVYLQNHQYCPSLPSKYFVIDGNSKVPYEFYYDSHTVHIGNMQYPTRVHSTYPRMHCEILLCCGQNIHHNGTQVSNQILFYCPSHPTVPWDRMDSMMESKYLSKFIVHPALLYHGLDRQYSGIQSTHIYLILLHIPSYCTMDSLDSIMESKCPSCPIVPQTGWTVQWKTSVYLDLCTLSYYPSCPIVPWTGWTVRWNPSVHSDLP